MIKKALLYFSLVALFVVEKPLFMLYHFDIYSAFAAYDWLMVMWHGLPLDFACASCIMLLPFLLEIIDIWFHGAWHRKFMIFYLSVIAIPLFYIFCVDLVLYTYWGIKLDATPTIYFTTNPGETILSAPTWSLIVFPPLILVSCYIVYKAFCRLYPKREDVAPISSRNNRLYRTIAAVVCCLLLLIGANGGLTNSRLQVGRVYYSQNMFLNHAATNPVFSFLSSLNKKPLSEQYRFMSDEEANESMLDMMRIASRNDTNSEAADSLYDEAADSLYDEAADSSLVKDSLLNTSKPNILLIIFESFSGSACTPITPSADPDIMPNVNKMYDDGIWFSNFYANSFRTDRGCAAILASYPGQPSYSVMVDSAKCENLQYLSKRLGENGYSLQFVHGGNATYTNMTGFLHCSNVYDIVDMNSFPSAESSEKWGVPDGEMFNYLYDDIAKQSQDSVPFFKTFLTLSSHEPFDVPFHRFDTSRHDLDSEYINSVAYSDSCFGSFIDRLKASPYWQNLLIIGVADHCFARYPHTIQNHEILRYHIPMFWTGGAIKKPRVIDTIGSQIDISATLLSQLDIEHSDFNFSKDLMDRHIPHYAFYVFSDGFGFLTDSCKYIQDNVDDGVALTGSVDPNGTAEKWGKAYLQKLYDDLSER